jgi:acetolactate synthase-1/2/3 large subunit
MQLTGAQLLVRQLRKEGVEVVFGLPGVQVMRILDALYHEPDMRFITTRHEQATTYMADGYARVTGRPGTALVVPGPGVYNAGAGLATAYACSSPVLLLAGQIPSHGLGQGLGLTHELEDQLDVVRPITTWAHRALTPDEIPARVREAFSRMTAGRPRPVELEIPPDVLGAPGDAELIDPPASTPPEPDPELIGRAVAVLRNARDPLMVAGGGVVLGDGSSAFGAVAEFLQAAIVTTREGKGSVDEHNPLFVGTAWNNRRLRPVIERADVILAVGTRYQGIGLQPGQTLIHIDIDAGEFGRNATPAIAIEGDARTTMVRLLAALEEDRAPRPDRGPERTAAREELHRQYEEIGPQLAMVRAMRDALPEDAVMVAGTTSAAYMCHLAYPVRRPRTYLTSSYMGTLGYCFPTALGAKVGRPDVPVVSVNGDGGFLYCASELATAVQYGINVVVVVFNDGAYGNTNRDQLENYGGRVIGTELVNPDFVAYAEAFGAVGVRAKGPDGLEGALREAVADNRPVLIEVPIERMPSVF